MTRSSNCYKSIRHINRIGTFSIASSRIAQNITTNHRDRWLLSKILTLPLRPKHCRQSVIIIRPKRRIKKTPEIAKISKTRQLGINRRERERSNHDDFFKMINFL